MRHLKLDPVAAANRENLIERIRNIGVINEHLDLEPTNLIVQPPKRQITFTLNKSQKPIQWHTNGYYDGDIRFALAYDDNQRLSSLTISKKAKGNWVCTGATSFEYHNNNALGKIVVDEDGKVNKQYNFTKGGRYKPSNGISTNMWQPPKGVMHTADTQLEDYMRILLNLTKQKYDLVTKS